jgi:hypothetical protein
MTESDVLDWLLEEDQPGVRYRTLTQLMGQPEKDEDVVEARRQIPRTGWASEILRERRPEGWWVDGKSLYRPKYLATNWKLLVLADLGVTRSLPEVAESCELWMNRLGSSDGGFGSSPKSAGHLCVAGNTARALIQFGFENDPRVRRALDWLVRSADPKGGWSCFGAGRNLDSWEALSAFAVYPRSKWNPELKSAAERGTEFFLQRELHLQGGRYEPWFRFHYPVHYYYDLLVGLDLVTALGHGSDPRIEFALSVLQQKRRPDGRWNLDAVHPDVEGGMAEWFRKHPKDRPTPWGLEAPGRPSKMVTLRALTVLSRIGPARNLSRAAPNSEGVGASVTRRKGKGPPAPPVRTTGGSRGRVGPSRAPGRSR